MLITVLYILLIPIAAIIIINICNEIYQIITIYKINQQPGVKGIYLPFTGIINLFFAKTEHNKNQTSTNNEGFNKLVSENIDKKALCINGPLFTKNWYLIEPTTYKDFFRQENNVSHREDDTFGFSHAFFMKRGQRALQHRGIFADFFQWDHIKNLMEPIRIIIRDRLKKMVNTKGINKDTWTKINWYEFDTNLFDDIVYEILFGFKENEKRVNINGKSISRTHQDSMELIANSYKSLFNFLTGYFFYSKMKDYRKAVQMQKEI